MKKIKNSNELKSMKQVYFPRSLKYNFRYRDKILKDAILALP